MTLAKLNANKRDTNVTEEDAGPEVILQSGTRMTHRNIQLKPNSMMQGKIHPAMYVDDKSEIGPSGSHSHLGETMGNSAVILPKMKQSMKLDSAERGSVIDYDDDGNPIWFCNGNPIYKQNYSRFE